MFFLSIYQETGTEHIFYGLDDIKQASDVIIVSLLTVIDIFVHFCLVRFFLISLVV